MWVEELRLENIRCFESETLRFTRGPDHPYPWVTFLSENGGGKSTALQALALLLAGPEGAQKLLPRPLGWLRDEQEHGKITTKVHQDAKDPGTFGKEKVRNAFGYTYFLTGSQPLQINHKLYTDASIVPAGHAILTWLRENAFPTKGTGWFAVGYGAFRRLTRSSQIIVPSLEPQARFTNFATQFDEAEPLSVFERWMIYLDYQIAKEGDSNAQKHLDMGIEAINRILPEDAKFDSVSKEGRIFFKIGGQRVPTYALSDGYRSVLALTGDLVWRLILSFPDSNDPLKEKGVVLIDELDIHLHPIWQREIAWLLRRIFPNLQFFVATHSPLVAAGAGSDALTLRFCFDRGKSVVKKVENVSAMDVNRILGSEAFGLVSPYSRETQGKIDRYDELGKKGAKRSAREEKEYQELLNFMYEARPIGGPPPAGSLDAKIEEYLGKVLR